MKTMKRYENYVFLSIMALILVGMAGCAKKVKPNESMIPNSSASDEVENTLGDSDSGKALGLQTIHFAFDSSELDKNAKSELKSNAKILEAKPEIKIQIEGHCDERGGIQYNIALGERRANSVKHYLADLGISQDRMTVISYGKERPLDRSQTEEAYAKNRRANFVVTSRK